LLRNIFKKLRECKKKAWVVLKKNMSQQILQNFIDEAVRAFHSYKSLADKAMAQITDEQFFQAIDEESNPVAAIVKHIGGNLRSRWTEFLTTDGEKADRHRDSEFEPGKDTRQSLMELWETGWSTLFATLDSLRPDDLSAVVKIRGEDHTVVKALNRSLAHTASHVGQIVFLAKHLRAKEWKTLSIPRNKSADFNSYMGKKDGATKPDPLDLHTDFRKETKEEKS
jgi:hypothetical protein